MTGFGVRSAAVSLATRVGIVMVVPAVVGLSAAYLIFSHVEAAQERASTRSDLTAKVHAVLPFLAQSPTGANLHAVQQLLGDDQLQVMADGRQLFAGPPLKGGARLQVTQRTPRGYVRMVGDIGTTTVLSAELTGVAALLVLFVLTSAALGTRVLLRAVRDPLLRAIKVADRLKAGDLSARIGSVGSPEFSRLATTVDAMAARLEDNDRRQRDFLADLAHEIATPVGTLTGIAAGVLDGTIRTPADREQAVELLDAELDRVRLLLHDIRELSSVESSATVRDEPVDLGAVCHRARARFRGRADAAGIHLEVRSQAVRIRSDQRLLETVIDNLMTNALRYTPRGGRTWLSVHRRGDDAVVTVKDTGPGIAADQQARVFERFYRTDTARDREHGGSGLGLAISQRAALALGGRVELESTPGSGSEFRLVLPAAARPPRLPTSPPQPAS